MYWLFTQQLIQAQIKENIKIKTPFYDVIMIRLILLLFFPHESCSISEKREFINKWIYFLWVYCSSRMLCANWTGWKSHPIIFTTGTLHGSQGGSSGLIAVRTAGEAGWYKAGWNPGYICLLIQCTVEPPHNQGIFPQKILTKYKLLIIRSFYLKILTKDTSL